MGSSAIVVDVADVEARRRRDEEAAERNLEDASNLESSLPEEACEESLMSRREEVEEAGAEESFMTLRLVLLVAEDEAGAEVSFMRLFRELDFLLRLSVGAFKDSLVASNLRLLRSRDTLLLVEVGGESLMGIAMTTSEEAEDNRVLVEVEPVDAVRLDVDRLLFLFACFKSKRFGSTATAEMLPDVRFNIMSMISSSLASSLVKSSKYK